LTVIALAKEIGFEGVDAGHLDASRSRAHHAAISTFTATFSAARSCHCDLPDVNDIRLGHSDLSD
jgi:hypothetical protein